VSVQRVFKILLRDRGGRFADAFDHVLAGAEVVRNPPARER
jgi:hypothetical protein